MSWPKEELCQRLREAGVQLNQSGYKSYEHRGRPAKHSLKERNEIKQICLRCQYSHCVYERGN